MYAHKTGGRRVVRKLLHPAVGRNIFRSLLSNLKKKKKKKKKRKKKKSCPVVPAAYLNLSEWVWPKMLMGRLDLQPPVCS